MGVTLDGHRHCGLDPQSRGVACGAGEQVQNNHILPSPLMGEESKVRVTARQSHHSTLWIDESPITLCQRVRFQRKGVYTLSFSSRERPAYAGMTGQVRHTGFKAVSTGMGHGRPSFHVVIINSNC